VSRGRAASCKEGIEWDGGGVASCTNRTFFLRKSCDCQQHLNENLEFAELASE